MEQNNTQIEARIAALETFQKSLQQSNLIPYNVNRAFVDRGFIQAESFFVAGTSALNVSGESKLIIPNATLNSIPMVCYRTTVGGELEAIIRESPTEPGQYELYTQGNATEEFNFVVFLFDRNYKQL